MIRSAFDRALGGEFRVSTDRLERLRTLAALATETTVQGKFQIHRQPRTKLRDAAFGDVLPYAHVFDKLSWTPVTAVALTESIGKQCLAGIELVNQTNESSLAIYDATTEEKDRLILVQNGEPWVLPLDDKHFANTQMKITMATQNFLEQA